MSGPKIKPEARDLVSPDSAEIILINPEHEARFKGKVATYLRSTPHERMKHPEPVVHRAVIRGIAILLHAKDLQMFRAQLQMRLQAELRLDRKTAQKAINQLEHMLLDMKKSRPLGRPSNTP